MACLVSHDLYIRERLCCFFEKSFDGDRIIVHELGCCQGAARIDVAVIANELHGYEIKSERDTLERLHSQITAYSNVFSTLTIVTTKNHLPDLARIPGWVGIWEVQPTGGDVTFIERRPASQNPEQNPIHLASLLWRDEALAILRELGIRARSHATRRELWSLLAGSLPIAELTVLVADRLRARGDWRVGVRQRLSGDRLQPGAKSSGSRSKLCRSRSPIYIGRPS